MNSFFLFFSYLTLLFETTSTTRADYNSTANSTSNNTLEGSTCLGQWDTTNTVFCPSDTWAFGFKLINATNYGILNIVLDCRGLTWDSTNNVFAASTSVLVQYTNWGGLGSLTLTTSEDEIITNGEKDFLRGYYLRMWCPNQSAFPKGVNQVMFQDSYSNNISTNMAVVNPSASWTGLSYCDPGYAICGYDMLYNKSSPSINKFGIVDIGLKCCRVCEQVQGYYFSAANICDFCDISCATCYGTATNCTLCPPSYTLSGNTCTTTISVTPISSEFFTNFTLDSTWSHNFGSINLTKYCIPFNMIGGYPIFVNGKWLAKTVNGLPTHTMLTISFRLIMIGNYQTNGYPLFYVDSVLELAMTFSNLNNPLYYSSNCGSGNLVTHTEYVKAYITHSASSVVVNFTLNSTTGYMGITRMIIQAQSCDLTCQTCTGTASNQCTSCPSNYFLTSSSTCSSACSSPYFADPSTWTCVTTCPSGYYGVTSSRTCVTVCPDNYYMNNADRLCYNPCTTYGDPTTGYCLSACPAGWYGDETSHICLPCDFNCQTCITYSWNCLTCEYSWLGATPTCSNPTCNLLI